MIPAGRTPLGTADIAARKGKKSLSRAEAEELPAPISRPGAQTRIWDAKQVDANLADRKVPELPGEESPKDLLDREEAREELEKLGLVLKPEAWRAYINHGYAPKPAKEVCGVPHWYRRTIHEWPDQRPGEGASAGRPKGSKDSKPRDRSADPRLARADARKERVRKLVEDADVTVTDRELAERIAEAEGITERQAYRLLNAARDEAE